MSGLPLVVLFIIIGLTLFMLAKGADILVEQAVALSLRWGVPTVVVGATIVSLGTTTPEAAVSVAAAISGEPGLALGNAVGSIITDCGLILGIAAIISPLKLDRTVVNRQGWIQIGAGFLLVLACVPWLTLETMFTAGGNLPQWMGFVLVGLLALYIWKSIAWSRGAPPEGETAELVEGAKENKGGTAMVVIKLIIGIAIVLISSQVLIPAVDITATRIGIPEAIIAATLVAFGTSLPELVTAVTAARRGEGGLAIGNVIGADILNVLFVAGLSAAVTPAGLQADPKFFQILFPGMLILLITFRVGIVFHKTHLSRPFGVVMLLLYLAVMASTYIFGVSMKG